MTMRRIRSAGRRHRRPVLTSMLAGGLALAVSACAGGVATDSAASDATSEMAATDGDAEAKPAPFDGEAAETTVAAPVDPASYVALSERDFAQLVKNPGAQEGDRIALHGLVTQFDTSTGADGFLANVAASPPEDGAYYDPTQMTQSAMGGDVALLNPLVQGDLFAALVTVVGTLDFDYQAGGSTTVPFFRVDDIEVTGQFG